MKYEAPQLHELANAVHAIQNPKGDFAGEESMDDSPAYEDWE